MRLHIERLKNLASGPNELKVLRTGRRHYPNSIACAGPPQTSTLDVRNALVNAD